MAEKLKILACPSNHGGCAYYRILLPMEKLAELYPDDVEFDGMITPWDGMRIPKLRPLQTSSMKT